MLLSRTQWRKEGYKTGLNVQWLDTGSTMLNLAISDRVDGGFPLGTVNNIIGDSSSGKTFLCMTSLACACANDQFDRHLKIQDDAEHADSFNKKKLFGSLSRKMQPPTTDENGDAENSSLVEDLESVIYHFNDNKIPYVYVLDSMDSLSCKAEIKASEERIKAHREGKQAKGSYGMGKAKLIGEFLRKAIKGVRKTNSLLLVISQTRTNINPMSFVKQTRSGGRALKFYSSVEMWMAERSKITKTVKGNKIEIGIVTRIKIKKNKVTGKRRTVELPIFYDYGIDDIGSCVDFLIEQKVWETKKLSIICKAWKFQGTRERLIHHIEDNELEKELKKLVQKAWDKKESLLEVNRKPRFQ